MNKYVIKTINLTKKFGDFIAVNNLNLKIKSGEIYVFLGPNGAGKTTTILMLVGVLLPTYGEIYYWGEKFSNDSIEIKRRIGFVPSFPYVYDKLTGYEFMLLFGNIYKVKESELKKRLDFLIDYFMLNDFIYKMIEEYSQGMKQRLLLAASIIHNPDVLIIDEPMNGLDPFSVKRLKELLKNLKNQGKTIFISTHYLDIAMELHSKIGIINKGNLIAEGTYDELVQLSKRKTSNLEDLFIQLTTYN